MTEALPTPNHSKRVISSRAAERRGRGIRTTVLPPSVPAWQSRSARFDALALEALSPIDALWHDQLTKVDIAVDEVPRLHAHNPESIEWPREITADGPVPLARLIPAGVDRNGNTTRARIVLFRKPIELRAKKEDELTGLLHEILVQQIASYLELDPSVIDPDLTEG
ncbi:MAG: metallopeptidase family protein [Mycobacteriaceae bacterium]